MYLVARETSSYNEITVYDTNELYGETGKFRFLQFADDAVQGAIDLKDPRRVVLEYPRAIMHLMEAGNPAFDNVFVIGHGIGTIAGQYPDKRFKVAEIDEKVVEASRRHFGYRLDNITVGDGRRLLEEEPPGALDAIIVDAFSRKGTPAHLTTAGFFELARDRLQPRGSLIMNLMGRTRNDKLTDAIHATLASVFRTTKAFVLPAARDVGQRNIVMVGSGGEIVFDARMLAGFVAFEPDRGYRLMDNDSDDRR